MPKPTRRPTRAAIVRALTRLGQLCMAQESRVEIAIYGGTVMILAYDCRAATKDIEAIFHPPEVVARLLARVARELALPEDWMNDGVRPFVATREERIAFAELAIPGLVVTRPSPKYLLAMKCLAGRLPTPFRVGDAADIKFLLRRLGLRTIAEVDAVVADYYGTRKLEGGKRWLVEKLLRETHDEKNAPLDWRRPHTLHAVVGSARNPEEIGLNLAEFLDHVNLLAQQTTGRRALHAGIRAEPPPTGDAVQDAYLAAVAAHLARKHGLPLPRWAEKQSRHLDRPWFALDDDWAKAGLLRDSPAAFRERNLFTDENALHRA